ncbi:hypothetical protein BZG36_03888 [Bifiguratus adelaidae]|uniref:CTLH domain-containing protein n=1 Tax=Bifiguratus adelaidae TaxID=1938954 RepID=A0A261XXQ9_9FUNG|nr:hypothetical protein BZG36_03888 [Bifiguratus adelaidae]
MALNVEVKADEVVRLVIQQLYELGYNESAERLEKESGIQLEAPAVAHFRESILSGNWTTAEGLLPSLRKSDGAGLKESKFLIRRQKFLEALENKDFPRALHVLQHELTPLGIWIDKVHKLSRLMMCSSEEQLRKESHWDGSKGTSRQRLLESLQHYISPERMLAPHRLQTLLLQAMAYQTSRCLEHNTHEAVQSLCRDHQCERTTLAYKTSYTLEGHTDEIWSLAFSNNGEHLVTASKDATAMIWETKTFTRKATLKGHSRPISFCAWSPDDSMILTVGKDHVVKLWSSDGEYLRTFEKHTKEVTACAWLSDGLRFLTASLDGTLYFWTVTGTILQKWTCHEPTDLVVWPDSSKFIVALAHCMLSCFDLETLSSEPLWSVTEDGLVTCLNLSRDGRYMLISLISGPIHLWDLEIRAVIRRYTGHQQDRMVIRSCLGGIDEKFVASGSTDGKVYIWHRYLEQLVHVLEGHKEMVNSVAWHPTHPHMLASASDDRTVRIWGL